MRIRLLDALRDGPLTINELTEALGASQQNVSKHIGVLAQAGIVARERDGNRVRCSIADHTIFELCELVCGGLRQQVAELDVTAALAVACVAGAIAGAALARRIPQRALGRTSR